MAYLASSNEIIPLKRIKVKGKCGLEVLVEKFELYFLWLNDSFVAMNIFLVYPLVFQKIDRASHVHHPFPALGLVYIATVLRNKGHRVEIADRNEILIKNNYDLAITDKVVLDRIKVSRSQIVGFSATTPLMYDVIHFSKLLKKELPNIVTIAGGPHPTAEPKETLMSCPDIDLVAEGEGEATMLELIGRFPDSNVPGIWKRAGNNLYTAGKRELSQDLDEIPIPDRNLLNMEFYVAPTEERHLFGRHTTIFTSRGCFGRCRFCAGPLMFPGKIRYHSPDYVIEEIEKIINLYKINYIYFADDMFLTRIDRAQAICDKIRERGLHKKMKWICQISAVSASLPVLKMMKEAGCVLIECGFESGSQEELDRMNKRASVSKYYELAAIAHKVGLNFRANMIKGYVDQTEKDFMLSGEFIKKIKPYFTNFNNFWPLPGTEAYKELLKRGYEISWQDCTDFRQNFTKMSNERFTELTHEIQKRIVSPLNKSNFKRYHLLHHPVYLLKHIYQKNFGHSH